MAWGSQGAASRKQSTECPPPIFLKAAGNLVVYCIPSVEKNNDSQKGLFGGLAGAGRIMALRRLLLVKKFPILASASQHADAKLEFSSGYPY